MKIPCEMFERFSVRTLFRGREKNCHNLSWFNLLLDCPQPTTCAVYKFDIS